MQWAGRDQAVFIKKKKKLNGIYESTLDKNGGILGKNFLNKHTRP